VISQVESTRLHNKAPYTGNIITISNHLVMGNQTTLMRPNVIRGGLIFSVNR
jgi:hypothetical protein